MKAVSLVTDKVEALGERAGSMAQGSLNAAREASQQLVHGVQRYGQQGVVYVREEPVKSVLIAAAAGAAIAAVLGLVARSLYRR